ncbi:uncharacterized protein LOC106640332 [Copidosoma floridanum]|uniref:uncharacterized protein LOC106640332 n=1 Tax=Copidosoma floridanum TaxID=29053 RepID=UPI0006C9B85B|nr:uncharacterized protein LOC106640332 [Copidosoma floridanum]
MPDDSGNCEQYLRGTKIGKDLEKRMKTGKIGEDRVKNFEIKETKKLQCIDEAHTKLYDLTIKEADRYAYKFTKFLENGTPPACPNLKQRVVACLINNSDDTLKCSEDVAAFANCVDDMMLAYAHHNDVCSSTANSKKLSYTEKFEQSKCS